MFKIECPWNMFFADSTKIGYITNRCLEGSYPQVWISTFLVGGFKQFCYFHPWGNDPTWLAHIFQMGGEKPPTRTVLVQKAIDLPTKSSMFQMNSSSYVFGLLDSVPVPFGELTWQLKSPCFNSRYIFKRSTFCCHVSLLEGIYGCFQK